MPQALGSWVVYLRTLDKAEKRKAVCLQAEWDAMDSARPGYHQLVSSGFATEREAELVARGTSGDAPKRGGRTGHFGAPYRGHP